MHIISEVQWLALPPLALSTGKQLVHPKYTCHFLRNLTTDVFAHRVLVIAHLVFFICGSVLDPNTSGQAELGEVKPEASSTYQQPYPQQSYNSQQYPQQPYPAQQPYSQ